VAWLSPALHVAAPTGDIIVLSWTLRRVSEAVLCLVAGLVAILGPDNSQSRADRALEVLRAMREVRGAARRAAPGDTQDPQRRSSTRSY
jgi:hypothetical protein